MNTGTQVFPQFSAPTTEIRDRALPPEVLQAAAAWPLFLDPGCHADEPAGLWGARLRCSRCQQAVLQLSRADSPTDHRPATISPQRLADAALAHVLQAHRRAVDPEWSGA